MDRSQRQLSRSERISNSPYKRPQQSQSAIVTPKSPISLIEQSFPSLRSIYSFVTAPFSRQPLLPQTNRDLAIEEDQKSESGSEDGWNGAAPPGMEREDVSSLAAPGRRGVSDIESRPEDNRKLGVSTSQEFRSSEPIYSTPLQQSTSLAAYPASNKSQFASFSPTPSQAVKRSITASTSAMQSRKPLPAFLPHAARAAPAQSAASIALAAFVEAKKGDPMNAHDMRVMRTLMEEMEAEQDGAPANNNNSGWTAATDSPRQVKSLRHAPTPAGPSTPNRLVNSIRDSPGPLFSVGSPGERGSASGVESPASRRIRYLGPGMSPKRMFNKTRTPSDKPLFTTDVAEESEPKRQKLQDSPETPNKSSVDTPMSPSPSIATPLPLSMANRAIDKIKATSTPAKPSPLSRSTGSTPPQSPREQESIQQGKRRAADIVKELMEEEIGPIESISKRDYMVINPYDLATPASSSKTAEASALTRSVSKSATPKKSILRSSLRSSTSTPLSGAAAKLEAYKPGRKLTTMELLEGKRPWTDSAGDSSMRSQSSSPEREAIEVDELMDESPAPSRTRSVTPPPAAKTSEVEISRPMPKLPEPFKAPAFKVPAISSPARPVPSFTPSPAHTASSYTTVKTTTEPITSATFPFRPTAHTPTAPFPEIENSTLASISARPVPATKKDWSAAQSKVFEMSTGSLPTFVFKITSPTPSLSPSAKSAALDAPIERYTFDLTSTKSSAATQKSKTPSWSFSQLPTQSYASSQTETWTCSLCSLQNPGTATEKCTICEAPRPAKTTPGPTTSSGGLFSFPSNGNGLFGSSNPAASSSGTEWTCDTCMLKNPDSAKEKCTICEARRPASKAAFSFGQPPTQSARPTPSARAPGPWNCSLCGLKNPESATEKCTICEEKRP